jgi:hypothetical protein
MLFCEAILTITILARFSVELIGREGKDVHPMEPEKNNYSHLFAKNMVISYSLQTK